MITVHFEGHAVHHSAGELTSGRFVPAYEHPGRVDSVLAANTTSVIFPCVCASCAELSTCALTLTASRAMLTLRVRTSLMM